MLCLLMYTQEDVDIDRLLAFGDVPSIPDDAEYHSLDGMEAWYKRYRENPGARNLMLFAEGNQEACDFFADTSNGQGAQFLGKHIKWECLFGALCQMQDSTTCFRSACNLPWSEVENFMSLQPGDTIFLPSITSTTMDR